MKGLVFALAKLHYINGVIYYAAKHSTTSLKILAENSSETTKSGDVMHPLARVRTIVRFAEGLGLLTKKNYQNISLTKLGRDYNNARGDDKWALSKKQKCLLGDYIQSNPSKSQVIFSITSLQQLKRSGFTGSDLAHRYAKVIGKDKDWNSEITYMDYTKFGLSYLEELDFLENEIEKQSFPNISIGETLSNNQLSKTFLCSTQGVMRRAKKTNSLVLISNHITSMYDDRWIGNVLHYTGMGQTGHQTLDGNQNKTLNESDSNGIKVFLFEVFVDQEYIYQGPVKLTAKPYQEVQKDKDDNDRQVWIFPLKLDHGTSPVINNAQLQKNQQIKKNKARRLSDEQLLERAQAAAEKCSERNVITTQFVRNQDIAEYVKRRAKGKCDLCEENAPFISSRGPYLEAHHIEWIADGGEDTIDNTVALCPNCHRKMHIVKSKRDVALLLSKYKKSREYETKH